MASRLPPRGRSPRRFRAVLTAVALAALATAACAWWWWTHPPDPARGIRVRHAPLASIARHAVPGEASLERWVLTDTRGRTSKALWKPARTGSAAWTLVLMGGLKTGPDAARLVPDSLAVHVLAVDWPWEGPRRMTRLQFVGGVPRIRESLLRSPSVLALGVEAVRRENAGGRIALMGVSLGVPPAVAALRITEADALLLADGPADFATQLERDARRTLPWPLSQPPFAGALGALGARLLEPLDPLRHGDVAPHTPTLLVEAAGDTRIPRSCRDQLRAAFPHATIRVQERDHVLGSRRQGVAAIVRDAHAWLRSL